MMHFFTEMSPEEKDRVIITTVARAAEVSLRAGAVSAAEALAAAVTVAQVADFSQPYLQVFID